MSNWTRRHVIGSAAALSTAALHSSWTSASPVKVPRPLIHVCDLYRPHDDPDDHWDLATVYAMACRGDIDLLGILTDNPENLWTRYKEGQNPDIAAVAQLNYLTDRAVPIATGTIWPGTPGEKVRAAKLPHELKGINMLLELLDSSAQPVAITVVGSCQDVAIAGKKEPRLFADKCAGIYLSAGVGSQDPKKQTNNDSVKWPWGVEWNVSLNRGAYATIFELPCPIYWMPCFSVFDGVSAREPYGTAWTFQQGEVLSQLRLGAQAYFSYAFAKECGANWLSYLAGSKSSSTIQKYFDAPREMYSTPGFLHAAGKTVTLDGEIVLRETTTSTLYEFQPIDVRCDENGITKWQAAQKPTDRYIFCIRDENKYDKAMAKALKSLLLALP